MRIHVDVCIGANMGENRLTYFGINATRTIPYSADACNEFKAGGKRRPRVLIARN